MKFRTVVRLIFEKYNAEEMDELGLIFSSNLPRNLKAEMLQYAINCENRLECEEFFGEIWR